MSAVITLTIDIPDNARLTVPLSMGRLRPYLQGLGTEALRLGLGWQMHIDGEPVEPDSIRARIAAQRQRPISG